MRYTRHKLSLFIFLSGLFSTSSVVAQVPTIDSVITAARLKAVVYQLAHDSLEGRLANSTGCIKAATIIADRMKAAGIHKIKGLDGYFEHLSETYQSVSNVVGELSGTGKPNEIVLISAHYDHIGRTDAFATKFTVGDDVYNGANDDASGVAVMLSLAEWFAGHPHQRTILFAAFSGEEIGMYGSKGFCNEFFPDSIVAQINLEMLGRRDVYQRPFITGYRYSNLLDLLNKALKDSAYTDNYFESDRQDTHNLFARSDNYPLALKGVPAHTIMLSTDYDKLYHTVQDEAPTLDYNNMTITARRIAKALEPLVQGQVTPNRIRRGAIPVSY